MEKYIYFINSKNINILLTDDCYLYRGLKEITGMPLIHMSLGGTMNASEKITGKGKIRVLIDNRIFSAGEWRGFIRLKKLLHAGADWIWLDIYGHCRFYPKGSEYDIYVDFQGGMNNALSALYKAYVRRRVNYLMYHYPRLTNMELHILQRMLDKKTLSEIQQEFKLNEKTASGYRSRIVRKFGCRRYGEFILLYDKNKQTVDQKWRKPLL
ncbi:helix-turn-helix transcriptional regulator [Citrobacter koseri]|uniref:helix-turn-helix transcriptional regulator n=1 Tax=Citrobacter koseri TaxID=545 RepID=UPI001B946977|nr:helix-turn-helix transcriptional regulator [Citrobacter koseri]MEB2728475.1 helix-turn-helix transcriptional regulator [Citrobacter koseri]HAV2022689.1 helix-turn-helix transcriptional regulator [Citrobacter koseri]HBC9085987.1 helix-turn-helix transcriptional regulator [Citrobacter koseri]HEO9009322.1 helix-turn-helix transcriptional regulator [Citrobacter koseri]